MVARRGGWVQRRRSQDLWFVEVPCATGAWCGRPPAVSMRSAASAMISDGASSERRELCLVGRPNLGNRNACFARADIRGAIVAAWHVAEVGRPPPAYRNGCSTTSDVCGSMPNGHRALREHFRRAVDNWENGYICGGPRGVVCSSNSARVIVWSSAERFIYSTDQARGERRCRC